MVEKLTREVVENWVISTSGWFDVKQLDTDLNLDRNAVTLSNRRVILHRLVKEGRLKRHSTKEGLYRLVIGDATLVDWKNADPGNIVDLLFPFGIEKLVTIYPKNVIVVSGTFNAGKTAFCLDFVRLNMPKHEVWYFTSEMGAEELQLRLGKFPMLGLDDWVFEARERSSGFADVVRPDAINVIDYLEVTDSFYLVAEEIAAIWSQLQKGVAVIAIQKKQGAKLGRGAEFSAEKPRLYLSMENNKLSIVKAKNWRIPGINPNGKTYAYSLVDGCRFCNIKEVIGD